MMRRLRPSAATPLIAARTRMTGFNLFAHEMQQQHRVLQGKSLKSGHQNMKVMAKLWSELTKRNREVYNERARQRNALKVSDPEKKHNTFNLVMRLFGEEKILLNAGDESFTTLMAKSTMQAMRAKDTQRLRAKLRIRDTSTHGKNVAMATTGANMRFYNPSMSLFDSFTEMQRCVVPTRKDAFTVVVKLASLSNMSRSAEAATIGTYNSLQEEEKNLFAPISDIESPFFEIFCASRCGSFDPAHFNIIKLFMQFRGIEVNDTRNREREQMYHSLLSADRSHDGAYHRARRNLERLADARSSDFGLLIAKRTPTRVKIVPTTYGIKSDLDDVSVAKMLAETRFGRSVYDDVLERAAVLRPREKDAQLNLYRISLKGKAEVVRRHTIPDAVVEKVPIVKKSLTDKMTTERVAETVAAKTKVKESAKKTETKVAAASDRKAAQTTPAKKSERRTASRTSSPQSTTAASSKKSRKAAPPSPRRKAMDKSEVRAAAAMEEERYSEDVEEDVVAAEEAAQEQPEDELTAVPRSPAHPSSAASAAFRQAFTAMDDVDVLAAMTEEEMDDLDATLSDDVEEEKEMDEDDAPVARAPPRKTATHRTARSHLTDPATMLPATARVQKLITKHATTRRRVAHTPVTTRQPSPYTPPTPPPRKVDMTANIRAMLSGRL